MRLLLAVLALASFPASAAADCTDQRREGRGSASGAACRGGGGMLVDRELTVGEPVEGELGPGRTYYVPAGRKLKVEFGGYTYRVAERGVFIPQCTFDSPSNLYFRLLEGRV